MPDYNLTWDDVVVGSIITLGITPADGTSVAGSLRLTTNGVQGPEEALGYQELVPQWKHTVGANESVHLSLELGFHTNAVSNINVVATCTDPAGAVHQPPPYNETYSGQQEIVTMVFVWADL